MIQKLKRHKGRCYKILSFIILILLSGTMKSSDLDATAGVYSGNDIAPVDIVIATDVTNSDFMSARTGILGAPILDLIKAISQRKIVIAQTTVMNTLMRLSMWWSKIRPIPSFIYPAPLPAGDMQSILAPIMQSINNVIRSYDIFDDNLTRLPALGKNFTISRDNLVRFAQACNLDPEGCIRDHYAIYKTPLEHFVVLVPKVLDAASVGFDLSHISAIPYEKLSPLVRQKKFLRSDCPFDEHECLGIFSKGHKAPKYIFMTGHGMYDGLMTGEDHKPHIAGFMVQHYKKLLNTLNQANCAFLYILTCYGGGTNLLTFHAPTTSRDRGELFDLKTINFPIGLSVTNDEPSGSTGYLVTPPQKVLEESLLDLMQQVIGHTVCASNIATYINKLYCHDLDRFFALLHGAAKHDWRTVPEALYCLRGFDYSLPAVWYPGARHFVVCPYVVPTTSTKPLVDPVAEALSTMSTRCIPTALWGEAYLKEPIKLQHNDSFCVQSIVYGPAVHVIERLEAPTFDVLDIMIGLAGHLGVTRKAFLIKQLVCRHAGNKLRAAHTQTIKNFMLSIEATADNAYTLSTVFQHQDNGIYYKAQCKGSHGPLQLTDDDLDWTRMIRRDMLTERLAWRTATKKSIDALVTETWHRCAPFEHALACATNGAQTKDFVQQKFTQAFYS